MGEELPLGLLGVGYRRSRPGVVPGHEAEVLGRLEALISTVI